MELDELKNTWQSLNERLNKQEILKETILKEIIHAKADKSLNRLIGYEVSGIIILILIIPVIIYALGIKVPFIEYHIFLFIMLLVCATGIIWQICKVQNLAKINFTKIISNNILYTNKYNLKIKKEKKSMLIFIPFLALSIAYLYAKMNANIYIWILMSCLLICAVIYTYWAYKKLYDKHIKSILKSLEDLKELEED